MKWRLQATGLFYDAGEGGVVFYDPASGDTHLLSDFSAHLLQQLTTTPTDLAEVTDRVRPALAADIDDPAGLVRGVLDELVDLHILKVAG